MNELKRTLSLVTYQLYGNALLRCALLAVSAYLLAATFTGASLPAFAAGLVGLGLGTMLSKPFQDKRPQAVRLIHQSVGDVEYSLPLLEKEQLNLAEQLQLDRLNERLQRIPVPGVLLKNAGWYALGLVAAVTLYLGYPLLQQRAIPTPDDPRIQVSTAAAIKLGAPTFQSAALRVQSPAYTQLPDQNSRDLNASAVVGSTLTWRVQISSQQNVKVRLVNSKGQELAFQPSGGVFTYQDQLLNSGLYAIKVYWQDKPGQSRLGQSRLGHDSLVYQSDFYRLDAKPDLAPKIEPDSKELYKFHFLKDPKTITIAARLSDDFAVSQAFIVATVARGSGESVKFREVKMPLGPKNFKETRITKTLDLKALNFAPGDELYYYWAAFDNRRPEPNFTKSDTYFLVYKDTTQVEESELATMAVNIMPEYFRSQRQIIIDTEKLIASKKKSTDKSFRSTSNEVGFDQKALRLRYGQFLGEEFEKSIGGGDALPTDRDGDVVVGYAAMQQYMHKHDEGEGDQSAPAAAPAHAGHDHGGHSHGGGGGNDEKDPVAALMEQYIHSHDDAETNTFHEQSTRSLLKMALENMWQSELHLRMYEPVQALPYEQKALEYLKLSQQKARSYVKKTGFDPPPIKEKELRLTGELNNVTPTFSQDKSFTKQRLEPLVASVLGYLDIPELSSRQRLTVQQLGNQLADQTINSGLQNWSVLASLQKLAGGKPLTTTEKQQLKTKLYALTGTSVQTGPASYSSERTLERAFWRHIRS
jgi:hypothetical protein